MLKTKKRVLLVDDAVVVRKVLSKAISEDPALEVVATAAKRAYRLVQIHRYKARYRAAGHRNARDGWARTERELRKLDSRVPVIMFSRLTERGAAITLEALALGATDYATKPSNVDGAATFDAVTRELIPKIRALCHLPALTGNVQGNVSPPIPPIRKFAVGPSRLVSPAKIVVIGVSTGGPDALAHVLPFLPAELPVPVLIAQHMPAIFTTMLATRLSAKSALPVRECISGETVAPGCAILAPGDFHMIVEKDNGPISLRTHQGPKENFCRPSVDVLFRSVASVYEDRTLAIVLTGMGHDGLKGCEMLRTAGARICFQDEASSVVWGMPGFVAKAGLADKILPLDQIAAEIVRATRLQVAARSQS